MPSRGQPLYGVMLKKSLATTGTVELRSRSVSEVRDFNSSFTSEAFSHWCAAKDDIWACCQLLTGWADRGYESAWQEASQGCDPEGDITWDFAERTGGLSPIDMAWMLRAGAIKDTVTAFEVYLEQSMEEALLRGTGKALRSGERSAPWLVLVGFHRFLGTAVDTERVRHIRSLRHLLTHRRCELCTDEFVQRFGRDAARHADENPLLCGGGAGSAEDPLAITAYRGGRVPLSMGQVRQVLDDLHTVVDEADRSVWAIAWDGDRDARERLRQLVRRADPSAA
jgi:hypothetical protein